MLLIEEERGKVQAPRDILRFLTTNAHYLSSGRVLTGFVTLRTKMRQKHSRTIVISCQSSLPKLSTSRQMAVKQTVTFASQLSEKKAGIPADF